MLTSRRKRSSWCHHGLDIADHDDDGGLHVAFGCGSLALYRGLRCEASKPHVSLAVEWRLAACQVGAHPSKVEVGRALTIHLSDELLSDTAPRSGV